MKSTIKIFILVVWITAGCKNKSANKMNTVSLGIECKDNCSNNKSGSSAQNTLSCKLTSPELQRRKETVIASLRKQVIEKKELVNGYAYKFNGNDRMLDELMEFVKTERQCCDFFTFNLSVNGDTSSIWFEITGTNEAKEFIKSEINL